jgi:Ser/Thr protein kinase RdoA (MazF antagonist)
MAAVPPTGERAAAHPDRWAAVCRVFELGAPREVTLVSHRTHRLWRVSTDRGRYAVKDIDIAIFGDDLTWLNETIAFELAAIEAGVPAPRPVPAPDGTVAVRVTAPHLAGVLRVHRWVDGQVCRPRSADPRTAYQAGQALAVMHTLRHPTRWQRPVGMNAVPSENEWTELSEAARRAGCGWADEVERTLPALVQAGLLLRLRLARPYTLITAHRDLTPRNVLTVGDGMAGAGIALLDWDTAGPWMPMDELAGAVVDWADGMGPDPRPDSARQLVRGYRDAGAWVEAVAEDIFATWLAKNAQWLALQIRRGLGHQPAATAQVQAAVATVPELLLGFRRGVDRLSLWLEWLTS